MVCLFVSEGINPSKSVKYKRESWKLTRFSFSQEVNVLPPTTDLKTLG